MALGSNGKYLATASADKTASIWDLSRSSKAGTYNHDDKVYGVAFSPDGKYLATASADGTAGQWEVSSEEVPSTPSQQIANLASETDALLEVPSQVPQASIQPQWQTSYPEGPYYHPPQGPCLGQCTDAYGRNNADIQGEWMSATPEEKAAIRANNIAQRNASG